MRVFLDTNVLVSAFATRGLCADVLRIAMAEHELIASESILEELSRVLREKFGVPEAEIHRIDSLLRSFHVEPKARDCPHFEIPDDDDAWIVASAINARAEVFVMGDAEILALTDRISELRIVTPRGFWNLIRHPR